MSPSEAYLKAAPWPDEWYAPTGSGHHAGRHYRRARVFYQGQPLRDPLHAEHEDAVLARAGALIAELQSQPTSQELYPDPTAWTVQLYRD